MRKYYVLIISMLLAGCDAGYAQSTVASHGESTSGGSEEHEAEPPRASPEQAAHVQIVEAQNVPQPTEVVGVVDVHEPGRDEQQGVEIMRERAAAMHADAVIGVEFHRDNHDFTDLSGLAVRYRNILQSRPYDVLQEIRVHEGEGGDDSMAELRRRARALNADLIINISWHDDDAVQNGTYLSGTAIRYR